MLKVSWPKDGARPTERELRASFEAIAPVTNVGLGGGNAALVVFADADGMNKAGSSYDGPWRVAPARSASPRPPMPPMGREVAVAQSAPAKGPGRAPPPMQPPMGREVAVHNSAPAADDAAKAAKHRRRAAKARAAADAGPPPRADAEAERARALHDKLERQARSDEAARLAAPPPRPSPVYERVASKLSATRRDQDAALEKEAAMWRERALRAEAAMSKPPPESPAVATMFQKHAASLREEVKATIEAALKEDRPAATPVRDDRPPPLEAAPPSPPSPPSLEGADDAPPAPLSPWRQAAQEAREDLAVSTERTSEADDAFATLMAKQHALAAKLEGDLERIREGLDEFTPPSTARALVPQTFDLLPARPPPPIYSYARPSSIRHLEPAFRPTNPALREWWAGVTRSSRAY